MALYLGGKKQKITLSDGVYNLKLLTTPLVISGVILKTLDDFILKSSNGVYITAKEPE